MRSVLFLAALGLASASCAQPTRQRIMAAEAAAPLQDDALRALLVDAYVSRQPAGYDGPGEFFRANGVYQRDGGHGAIVAEGLFEIRDSAVCVWGDTFTRFCRHIVANGDGTYTFINTANGLAVVMAVLQQR